MDVNSFEPTVANTGVNNWRIQMPTVHRERIIHRIIENLRRRIPALGQLEPSDIQNVAKRFEERIFLHAKSQGDYVQKISSKLISLYRLTPNLGVNSSPSDCTCVAENSVDQASCLQPQHHEQGISISNFLTSQSQASQQLSPQNILKNTTSSGSHSNANARLKLTTATNSRQTLPNTFDQNSMLQSTLENPVDSQQLQQVVPQQNEQQPQISYQNPCNQELQHNELQQTRMEEQRTEYTHMVSSAEKQDSFTQASSPMNAMQTAPSLNLTHNQQCSVHQSVSEENPLSVLSIQQQQHQNPTAHKNQASVPQRTLAQQEQQLVIQLPICNNIEQDQQNREQKDVTDTHQQQQVLVWNHHSSTQAQQLGQQRNYPRLRSVQSRISGSVSEEQNEYMLQQDEVAAQLQPEQIMATLLPTKGQKFEPQLPEQQINSQIQLQQQQPNILQQEMLLRHQTSDSFLQHHAIKQKKLLSQSAISFPAESSNLTSEIAQKNEDDCGEEIYEKIKAMSNMFQPELKKIFQKISIRYQQLASLLQQSQSDEQKRLHKILNELKCIIGVLNAPKNKLPLDIKGKMGAYERCIKNFIASFGTKKSVSPTHQGQIPQLHVQTMSQPSQSQSQCPLVQPHEKQNNSQLKPGNLCHSKNDVRNNSETSLQHDSIISSGTPASHLNVMNSQYPASPPQSNTLSSERPRYTDPIPLNPNMVQSMYLEQQKEQKMLKVRQPKQQCQSKHKLIQQKQQKQEQLFHQRADFTAHQTPQVLKMNDLNDMNVDQEIYRGILQQHQFAGPHSEINNQQVMRELLTLKSSPQLIQVTSSQNPQHSSPQVGQKHFRPSFEKAETSFQSLSSSSIIGNPENLTSTTIVSSGNVEFQGTPGAVAAGTSSLTATSGLSASPSISESNDPDGNHENIMAIGFRGSNVTKNPIERLMIAVGSISCKALRSSVDDMESVVNMVDRTAGTEPGNGSRAAVGEDLMTTTCHSRGGHSTEPILVPERKNLLCYTSPMPSNTISSAEIINDSFKQLTDSEIYGLESTATSCSKRRKIEVYDFLLKEVKEINQRLTDTVVDFCDNGVNANQYFPDKGIIVKCSFTAVSISADVEQHPTDILLPILPLRVLVPMNYPKNSPILLENISAERRDAEDFSVRAKLKLDLSLRSLKQPMSLGEIAKAWDNCVRQVICEYAQQHGGGNFSSRYGTWENCQN